MSEKWANRQRNSNRVVRKIANYLFKLPHNTPEQLYGIAKLAWITEGLNGKNPRYIYSTKIPALEAIFNRDWTKASIEKVARDIGLILKDKTVVSMLQEPTGFTNFYKAYRNSSLDWVKDNFDRLLPLYKKAFQTHSNTQRKKLVEEIIQLPGIPKANNPDQLMKPEFFLTPAFFMLDPKIKFPIINGNDRVKNLLKVLNVSQSGLMTQYSTMVDLYGTGGIKDAADLDQVGENLHDFVDTPTKRGKRKLLQKKPTTGNELPLKDEDDIDVLKKAGTIKQRRIHNKLTNKLKKILSEYTLYEGRNKKCLFDVLVQNYENNNDLLIEVKSAFDRPNIRMAIGQLHDYWYELKGDISPHLAILVPNKPPQECIKFTEWMEVGLLWFEDNELCTSTAWLEHLES